MISISAGRDYNTYNKYEFVVFDITKAVALTGGGFSSNAAAKKLASRRPTECLA